MEASDRNYEPEVLSEPEEGVNLEGPSKAKEDSASSHLGDEFIPWPDLTLDQLPPAIRSQANFDFIRSIGGRIVQIVVKSVSSRRKDSDPFKGQKNLKGTGFALYFHNQVVIICTNKHILYNDEEVANSVVYFFYDDLSEETIMKRVIMLKKGSGIRTISSKSNVDFTLAVYRIGEKQAILIETYFTEEFLNLAQPQTGYEAAGSDSAIVCIISHPAGKTKHVSFGCITDNPQQREFHHDAPTRKGSSGAPILVFSRDSLNVPLDSVWYHVGSSAQDGRIKIARLQLNDTQLFVPDLQRGLPLEENVGEAMTAENIVTLQWEQLLFEFSSMLSMVSAFVLQPRTLEEPIAQDIDRQAAFKAHFFDTFLHLLFLGERMNKLQDKSALISLLTVFTHAIDSHRHCFCSSIGSADERMKEGETSLSTDIQSPPSEGSERECSIEAVNACPHCSDASSSSEMSVNHATGCCSGTCSTGGVKTNIGESSKSTEGKPVFVKPWAAPADLRECPVWPWSTVELRPKSEKSPKCLLRFILGKLDGMVKIPKMDLHRESWSTSQMVSILIALLLQAFEIADSMWEERAFSEDASKRHHAENYANVSMEEGISARLSERNTDGCFDQSAHVASQEAASADWLPLHQRKPSTNTFEDLDLLQKRINSLQATLRIFTQSFHAMDSMATLLSNVAGRQLAESEEGDSENLARENKMKSPTLSDTGSSSRASKNDELRSLQPAEEKNLSDSVSQNKVNVSHGATCDEAASAILFLGGPDHGRESTMKTILRHQALHALPGQHGYHAKQTSQSEMKEETAVDPAPSEVNTGHEYGQVTTNEDLTVECPCGRPSSPQLWKMIESLSSVVKGLKVPPADDGRMPPPSLFVTKVIVSENIAAFFSRNIHAWCHLATVATTIELGSIPGSMGEQENLVETSSGQKEEVLSPYPLTEVLQSGAEQPPEQSVESSSSSAQEVLDQARFSDGVLRKQADGAMISVGSMETSRRETASSSSAECGLRSQEYLSPGKNQKDEDCLAASVLGSRSDERSAISETALEPEEESPTESRFIHPLSGSFADFNSMFIQIEMAYFNAHVYLKEFAEAAELIKKDVSASWARHKMQTAQTKCSPSCTEEQHGGGGCESSSEKPPSLSSLASIDRLQKFDSPPPSQEAQQDGCNPVPPSRTPETADVKLIAPPTALEFSSLKTIVLATPAISLINVAPAVVAAWPLAPAIIRIIVCLATEDMVTHLVVTLLHMQRCEQLALMVGHSAQLQTLLHVSMATAAVKFLHQLQTQDWEEEVSTMMILEIFLTAPEFQWAQRIVDKDGVPSQPPGKVPLGNSPAADEAGATSAAEHQKLTGLQKADSGSAPHGNASMDSDNLDMKTAGDEDEVTDREKNAEVLPLNVVVMKLTELVAELSNVDGIPYSKTACCLKSVTELCEQHHQHGRQLGQELCELDFSAMAMKITRQIQTLNPPLSEDHWQSANDVYDLMQLLCSVSPDFTTSLVSAGAVEVLTTNLCKKNLLDKMHIEHVKERIDGSIKILYIIAQRLEDKTVFAVCKTAQAVLPFTGSRESCLRVCATLLLCCVVGDGEVELLCDTSGTIKLMMSWLMEAAKISALRIMVSDNAFPTVYLLHCLTKLAIHPGNRIQILQAGALPLFTGMLQTYDADVQEAVIDCVKTLASAADVGHYVVSFTPLTSQLSVLAEASPSRLQLLALETFRIIKKPEDGN